MASTSLREKQALLADCTERISQLEHELCIARKLEQQLQDEIRAAISRNPPIGKLPVEILNLIFEESALSDPSITSAISMVCRMWRNIALNTPRLWSTIQVEVDMNKLDQLHTNWGRIVTYLNNSGSMGLDISLNYPGPNSWSEFCFDTLGGQWETMCQFAQTSLYDIEVIWQNYWESDNNDPSAIADIFSIVHQKAMNLLIGEEGQHMRRWRYVSVRSSANFPMYDDYPTFFQYPTPMLERLEICGITFPDEPDSLPHLPTLKHLELNGSGIWNLADRCENLEVYGLQDYLHIECISGVLKCTNLRKLSLGFMGDPYFEFLVDEATLPHLTDLYLEDVPRWMINSFDLPRLTTLVIESQEFYLAFPQVRNVYWILQSGSALEDEGETLKGAMEYYSNGDVFGVNQSLRQHFLSTYERWDSRSHFQTLEVIQELTSTDWLRQGFSSPLEKTDLKSLMITSPHP